ncbi:MAG: alpha/beta hydrolase [Betaproteobacteria bacterium]|nr:MAG: alpha/beta hydrolase [Betaproteobacteria bacterium]
MFIEAKGSRAYAYTGTKPLLETQPTAVFIHGAANDHSVWALQSRYFAHHGWNVLALDLPAHGQSEGALCTSIESLAKFAAAVLDEIKIKSACVFGHSMGSLTALQLAADRPDLVAKLGMIGTAVPMAVGDVLLDAAANHEDKARQMIVDWSYAPASQLGNNHKVPGTWLPGAGLALMRRMVRGVLHNDLHACKTYANGLEAAKSINLPTLFIVGERDMMTPPKAASAAIDAIKDARVVRLQEAGHSMLSEAPDACLKAMWEFANTR